MAIASAIVGGLISSAGAIGSAVIGSKAASNTSKAAQASADASIAAQERARASNQANLSPFLNTGTAAMGQINALLGLGGAAGMPGTPGQSDYTEYVSGNPDLMAEYQRVGGRFGSIGDYGQFHWNTYGQNEGRAMPMSGGTPGTNGTDGRAAAENAFNQFRNSTGYDFRVKQGMNAVNSGYAGAGTIKSGAAIKGANDYGQGMATQEFGNYLGALGNQQALGMQAGSAIAGVSQNAANSMSQIYQQNGANQANAALLKAQNTGQALNSLATIGAGLFGQSQGQQQYQPNQMAASGFYNPNTQF